MADPKFAEAPSAKAASRKPAAKAADSDAPASAAVDVTELSPNEEIAARTAPEADADGRFVKVFVVMSRDWDVDGPVDDMHRANQVATLQDALNHGLHPTGEASFDGPDTEFAPGSVALKYSVPVVLAYEHDVPAETYTPRAALVEMGGSSIKDAQESDPDSGK